MVRERLTAEELALLHRSQSAVQELIEGCQKGGHVYHTNPQRVADINRASKRLRAAIASVLAEQEAEAEQRPSRHFQA